MGAEVIALGLEQVCGQAFTAEAIEEGERGAERGNGDAFADCAGDDFTPGALAVFDGLFEEGVEQEVLEFGFAVEGAFDIAEEGATDDAASAPHEGDSAVVEFPAVFFGGGSEEHVALGVGDDFGGVEGFSDIFDPGGAVSGKFGVRAAVGFCGGGALVFHGGDATGVDCFGDESDGDAEVLGGDDCPFSGALLTCGIEDFVDERGAVIVFEAEDIAGDFDEVGVEFPCVPICEDGVHFVSGHAEAVFHEVIGFTDELHIAVFDPVMDHFDVVSGAVIPDPVAAGGSILDLG